MSTAGQVVRIARTLFKLAPKAVDAFDELAAEIASKEPDEQERLAAMIAGEIRRRKQLADDAIEFMQSGKRRNP